MVLDPNRGRETGQQAVQVVLAWGSRAVAARVQAFGGGEVPADRLGRGKPQSSR